MQVQHHRIRQSKAVAVSKLFARQPGLRSSSSIYSAKLDAIVCGLHWFALISLEAAAGGAERLKYEYRIDSRRSW